MSTFEEQRQAIERSLLRTKATFYLGKFPESLAQSTELRATSPGLSNELLFMEYRARIAMSQYDYIVNDMTDGNRNDVFESLRTLATFLSSPSPEVRSDCVKRFDEWMVDPILADDVNFHLVASQIYYLDGNMKKALLAVHTRNSLEKCLMSILLLIRCFRLDLARAALDQMRNLGELSTLTQLAEIYVNIAANERPGLTASKHTVEHITAKYGSSVILLNLLAVIEMSLDQFESASASLSSAYNRDVNDAATLLNSLVCATCLDRPNKLEPLRAQLRSLDSRLVRQSGLGSWQETMEEKEQEFDRLAESYLL